MDCSSCNLTKVSGNISFLMLHNATVCCNRSYLTSEDSTPLNQTWSSISAFSLFVIIAGSLLNSSILFLFLTRPSLRSSFAVYLINLLIIDLLLAVAFGPLVLVEKTTGDWTLGHGACIFRNYLGYVCQQSIILAHLLIALNRLWAVTFPFSYRTHHTTRFAIVVCLTVWLVVGIGYAPLAVITTIVLPGQNGSKICFLNTDTVGAGTIILQAGLFEAPLVIIVVVYPLICFKSFFSARKQRISPLSAVTSRGAQPSAKPAIEEQPTEGRATNTDGEKVTSTKVVRVCGRRLVGSRTGFVTLTLVTLSATACLLPNEIFYTVFMVTGASSHGVLEVVDTLQRLTTVFDPVLIVLGNTALRRVITGWLSF